MIPFAASIRGAIWAASFSLCVVFTALWIRSYWVSEWVFYRHGAAHGPEWWQWDEEFTSSKGRLIFHRMYSETHFYKETPAEGQRRLAKEEGWYRKLFSPETDLRPWLENYQATINLRGYIVVTVPLSLIAIPHGLIVLPSGMLCLAMAWPRIRRAYRRRKGQCGRCGYDLRASHGKCPECGEPILSKEIGTGSIV